LVRYGIQADRKRKLKLKISKVTVKDDNVGLLLDADTYVENFLRSKIVRQEEGGIWGSWSHGDGDDVASPGQASD